MGQIAGDGALASFILAGVMLLLSGFGLLHYRKVPAVEELGATHVLRAAKSWSNTSSGVSPKRTHKQSSAPGRAGREHVCFGS